MTIQRANNFPVGEGFDSLFHHSNLFCAPLALPNPDLLTRFYEPLFGRKPNLPSIQKLDLGQEQKTAIGSNQANLPAAENLVGQANQFSQSQIDSMISHIIPNFKDISATAGTNIESELKGQIPQDVQDAIQNSAAARSLGAGTEGSGMARDLVARDLGLTSLNLTNRGLASAESWMKETASIYEPSMMKVGSMFITPEQQYAADNEQNLQQFQNQWMRNQIDAMPDPVIRGVQDTVMQLISAVRGGSSTPPQSGQQYAQLAGQPSNDPSLWGSPGAGGTYDPGASPTSTDIPAGGDFSTFSGDTGMVGDFGAGFGGSLAV